MMGPACKAMADSISFRAASLHRLMRLLFLFLSVSSRRCFYFYVYAPCMISIWCWRRVGLHREVRRLAMELDDLIRRSECSIQRLDRQIDGLEISSNFRSRLAGGC